MKYRVVMNATVYYSVHVEADDDDSACEKAREKFKLGLYHIDGEGKVHVTQVDEVDQ